MRRRTRRALTFPDRIDYVDCFHRGMADVYVLDVVLTLVSEETGAVAAGFTQRVRLGAI